MKTTRIAANKIGHKMLVQIAATGLDAAVDLLEERVEEMTGWIREDAEEILEEMRG